MWWASIPLPVACEATALPFELHILESNSNYPIHKQTHPRNILFKMRVEYTVFRVCAILLASVLLWIRFHYVMFSAYGGTYVFDTYLNRNASGLEDQFIVSVIIYCFVVF